MSIPDPWADDEFAAILDAVYPASSDTAQTEIMDTESETTLSALPDGEKLPVDPERVRLKDDAVKVALERAEARVTLERTPPPPPVTVGRGQLAGLLSRRFAYVDLSEELGIPGARARIQSLTSAEIGRCEEKSIAGKGTKTSISLRESDARYACFGWIDDAGERLFNPNEDDEVRRVAAMDGGAIRKVAKKIRELSGMANEDTDGEEDEESGKSRTRSA